MAGTIQKREGNKLGLQRPRGLVVCDKNSSSVINFQPINTFTISRIEINTQLFTGLLKLGGTVYVLAQVALELVEEEHRPNNTNRTAVGTRGAAPITSRRVGLLGT